MPRGQQLIDTLLPQPSQPIPLNVNKGNSAGPVSKKNRLRLLPGRTSSKLRPAQDGSSPELDGDSTGLDWLRDAYPVAKPDGQSGTDRGKVWGRRKGILGRQLLAPYKQGSAPHQ
jgi:hypothetical protein